MKQDVTITYLEMLEPAWLKPKECPEPVLDVVECDGREPELFKSLYQTVGAVWQWTERLSWSDEQWADYAACETMRTWVAYQGKQIAGYFELVKDGGDVEIKYFGLTGDFIGKGCGGYLLTEAIRCAWDWDPSRVWLHTCTLDHDNAIANYKARGMRVYKEETVEKDVETTN